MKLSHGRMGRVFQGKGSNFCFSIRRQSFLRRSASELSSHLHCMRKIGRKRLENSLIMVSAYLKSSSEGSFGWFSESEKVITFRLPKFLVRAFCLKISASEGTLWRISWLFFIKRIGFLVLYEWRYGVHLWRIEKSKGLIIRPRLIAVLLSLVIYILKEVHPLIRRLGSLRIVDIKILRRCKERFWKSTTNSNQEDEKGRDKKLETRGCLPN